MENNMELLENVQEVLVEEEVFTKPNSGASKVALAIGVGALIGGIIYKKFAKSKKKATSEVVEVEIVEETDSNKANE